jgi:hypothetical protein
MTLNSGGRLSLAAVVAIGLAVDGAYTGASGSESDALATPFQVAADQEGTEPGAHLRVWLVTAAQGDAVWERYGHNAIRVLDTETGQDVSYNWGYFDFQQVDFIPRFLQGRMLYMMLPLRTRGMIDSYRVLDREVVMQELALSPAQKIALQQAADENALPENRDYFYQYFLDNCSTRVRDLLDRVLDGALSAAFVDRSTGTSYRDHTRRLTQVDPLIYTGIELLLGSPTDQPISVWEEMFLPMTLRDHIRELTVVGPDGVTRPLVMSEETVVTSSRPTEPSVAKNWLPIYAALGLALGALLASMGTMQVKASKPLRILIASMGTLWCALAGVGGTILVLLLFTDHTFAHWNENLFLFHPALLVLAVVLPFSSRDGRWAGVARVCVIAVAGIAVLGLAWQLVPWSTQANAALVALALPPHLGLLYALTRPATPRPSPAPESP